MNDIISIISQTGGLFECHIQYSKGIFHCSSITDCDQSHLNVFLFHCRPIFEGKEYLLSRKWPIKSQNSLTGSSDNGGIAAYGKPPLSLVATFCLFGDAFDNAFGHLLDGVQDKVLELS